MGAHASRRIAALGIVCVLALAVTGIILATSTAVGQDEPRAPVVREGGDAAAPEADAPRDRPEAGQRRGAGDEARRRFDQDRAQRFAAEASMVRQAPAIAVAEGKVYVVLNGVLYKFDAETLAVEAQQRIPRPDPPFAAFRGRGGGEGRPRAQEGRAGDRN